MRSRMQTIKILHHLSKVRPISPRAQNPVLYTVVKGIAMKANVSKPSTSSHYICSQAADLRTSPLTQARSGLSISRYRPWRSCEDVKDVVSLGDRNKLRCERFQRQSVKVVSCHVLLVKARLSYECW